MSATCRRKMAMLPSSSQIQCSKPMPRQQETLTPVLYDGTTRECLETGDVCGCCTHIEPAYVVTSILYQQAMRKGDWANGLRGSQLSRCRSGHASFNGAKGGHLGFCFGLCTKTFILKCTAGQKIECKKCTEFIHADHKSLLHAV